MKRFLILTLTIFCLFSGVSYAEGANLVQNPGFEDSDSPSFWNQYIWESSEGAANISISSDVHHSGNNCAKIVNNKANDTRLKQTIAVEPSTVYKISGWVKTENVGTVKKGANLSADMIMETSKDVRSTSDWQLLEVYGRTGGDQKTLILTAGLGGYDNLNTGTAYIDDVSVEVVTDLPADANVISLYSAQANNNDTSEGGSKSWMIILALLCIAAIVAVVFFVAKKPSSPQNTKAAPISKDTSKSKNPGSQKPHAPVFKIDRKDLITMGVMTLIYIIIALINLGSLSVPETFWKPTTTGEGFVVKFDREYDISRIGYYNNIGDGKYTVKYKNSSGKFLPIDTIKQDVYNVLRWNYFENLQIKTNEIRITVDAVNDPKHGPAISEITFYEKGSKVPIKEFTFEEFSTKQPNDKGSVKNLFDEQDKHSYYNTYMNSSYFDEIYHPRTALENIERLEPYETTHPPLGKAIMALGILLFGMNPFGWRIMGTLFGAAMIPAMYLLGKKMFNKRIFGFISAFLMMFDCMHFTQTRIGTIDSYPTLFLILTYFFMYDVFMKKSYKQGFKQTLKPLLLAGICWALGSASKWTAVYAAFGIAILFIVAKVLEIRDYNKATNPRNNKGKLPLWTKNFYKKNIVYTCLCCIIFFIVIPVIIYTASYLPIITLPGPNHDLNEVVRYQQNMLGYHEGVTDDHPFMSKPWQWPLNYKPLLEYRDTTSLSSSKLSYMYVMGNPFIFWFGLLCIFMSIFIGIWKRDKRVFFLIVAFACQYLPWFPIKRCLFIYHYFTAVPFLIMFVVYILKFLHDDLPKIIGKANMSKRSELSAQKVTTGIVYGYLALVALMFIFLYPAISGYVVDNSYLDYVRWLYLN